MKQKRDAEKELSKQHYEIIKNNEIASKIGEAV
jgi:hypothetical protein